MLRTNVVVEVEAVIGRPRSDVWAFLADPTGSPEWLEEFEAAEWVDAPRAGVGADVRFHLAGGRSGTYRIIEWEPERRLAWDGPPMPWPRGGATRPRGFFALRDAGGEATAFVAHFEPELLGTAVLLRPYLKRWLRRTRIADVRRLKELLESRAP